MWCGRQFHQSESNLRWNLHAHSKGNIGLNQSVNLTLIVQLEQGLLSLLSRRLLPTGQSAAVVRRTYGMK